MMLVQNHWTLHSSSIWLLYYYFSYQKWLLFFISYGSSGHGELSAKPKYNIKLKSITFGHQSLSKVINCHQWSSIVINGHQLSSIVINGHQWSSMVINGHQWSSIVITHQSMMVDDDGWWRWLMIMVDDDGWWWRLMMFDHDNGWWWRLMMFDHDNGCWWLMTMVSDNCWGQLLNTIFDDNTIIDYNWQSIVTYCNFQALLTCLWSFADRIG